MYIAYFRLSDVNPIEDVSSELSKMVMIHKTKPKLELKNKIHKNGYK